MKLVFLIDRSLDARYCIRYGFGELIDSQVNLEIWDCAPLISQPSSLLDAQESIKQRVKRLQSRDDVMELVSGADVFCVDVLSSNQLEFVVKTIREYGGKIVRHKGVIPFSAWKPTLIERIRYVLVKFRSSKNKLLSLQKILHRLVGLKLDASLSVDRTSRNVDIWMCAGTEAKKKIRLDSGGQMIWTHHYDYDVFLYQGTNPTNGDYVVYLDNADFDHPDIETLDYYPQLTFDKYTEAMRPFLDFVEKNTGYDVVIAGHPRVNEETLDRTYKGRKVYQNRTPELVQSARLVIAMDSTAINYAVLWNKPLVIITTKEAQRNSFFLMAAIEQILAVKPINIDKDYRSVSLMEYGNIPRKIYPDYIDRFIKKSGTEDKNRWLILLDKLQEVLKNKAV